MGKPDLVAVTPHGGVAEEELLTLAAAVERGSEHPLGAAIVAGAEARSEEHTSELQSLMRISYAVFCLKKKKTEQIPLCVLCCDTTYSQTINTTKTNYILD